MDDILRVSGHLVDNTDGQMSDPMDFLNINIQNKNHMPVAQLVIWKFSKAIKS